MESIWSAINYMLGMALIRSGAVAKGQALVDGILRDGDSAEAHFVLGTAVFMAKDYPNAVKNSPRPLPSIRIWPRFYSYYGKALLFTGDAEGAVAAFRKQLASDPNDYDANLRLAQILFLQVRPGRTERP